MVTKTGIVLQGGGALGAYQYGALQALYERTDLRPSIVTGVSIGAINAAVLLGAKGDPIEALAQLWDTLKMTANPFLPESWQAKAAKAGNPAMYQINPKYVFSPLTAESIYDLTPFWRLLEELIDLDAINNHPTRLLIEAVNVETGELRRFENRPLPDDPTGITLEKIVASMSIPPNFPMVASGNNYYWDGGLYANMPLAPAINYLENTEADTRELVVVSLFRKQAVLPETIAEIADRIKEIIFQSKLELDQKFFKQVNEQIELFEAIDAELPTNSPVRQHPTYQKLAGRKKIDRALVLNYDAEGVAGTDDFTPHAIDYRYRQGYRDMLAQLSSSELLINA